MIEVRTCEKCGSSYSANGSRKRNRKRKYCSVICSGKARSLPAYECGFCRLQFKPSDRHSKYCSQLCAGQARVKITLSACLNCGQPFTKKQRENRVSYCSKVCGGIARRRVSAEAPTRHQEKSGYVKVYYGTVDGRPRYRHEHRAMMEERLGRRLLRNEHVHHKNGVRSDNRIDNLELWTTSHPSGQRVQDQIAWALDLLRTYKNTPIVWPAGIDIATSECYAAGRE